MCSLQTTAIILSFYGLNEMDSPVMRLRSNIKQFILQSGLLSQLKRILDSSDSLIKNSGCFFFLRYILVLHLYASEDFYIQDYLIVVVFKFSRNVIATWRTATAISVRFDYMHVSGCIMRFLRYTYRNMYKKLRATTGTPWMQHDTYRSAMIFVN